MLAPVLTAHGCRGLKNSRREVNLIVVSDHGMAAVAPSRIIYLDDVINAATPGHPVSAFRGRGSWGCNGVADDAGMEGREGLWRCHAGRW